MGKLARRETGGGETLTAMLNPSFQWPWTATGAPGPRTGPNAVSRAEGGFTDASGPARTPAPRRGASCAPKRTGPSVTWRKKAFLATRPIVTV